MRFSDSDSATSAFDGIYDRFTLLALPVALLLLLIAILVVGGMLLIKNNQFWREWGLSWTPRNVRLINNEHFLDGYYGGMFGSPYNPPGDEKQRSVYYNAYALGRWRLLAGNLFFRTIPASNRPYWNRGEKNLQNARRKAERRKDNRTLREVDELLSL